MRRAERTLPRPRSLQVESKTLESRPLVCPFEKNLLRRRVSLQTVRWRFVFSKMASENHYLDSDLLADQNNSQNVIVDNGLLVIEELRPPDKPQDRELREYVDKTTRSIHPVTGDQVVFRLIEADSGSYIDSGAGDLDLADCGTPQVAILGSPQVPVGLSSALGYLQLGHLARIKVPADFMKQAVTDTDAALHSLPSSTDQQQPVTPHSAKAVATPHTTPTAAAVHPHQLDNYRQAPASAAAYTKEDMNKQQAPAAAANGGSFGGSSGSSETPVTSSSRNTVTGVLPPVLPAAVPEQQTLRERFQQQQQPQSPGMVAALAAKYQKQQDQVVMQQPQHSPGKSNDMQHHPQQQAVHMLPDLQAVPVDDLISTDAQDQHHRDHNKPQATNTTAAAAAGSIGVFGSGFPGGGMLQRQDSDHSSWLQDSVRSSMNDPAATARYNAAAGSSAAPLMMSARTISASGWTSGTISPRNESLRASLERIGEAGWHQQPPLAAAAAAAAATVGGSSSNVYETPGGTHFYSASSTPVPFFGGSSGGSSSAGDLRLGSPAGDKVSPFHHDKVTYDNKVTSNDDDVVSSPEECASPEWSSSPHLRHNRRQLPAAAAIAKDVTATLNAAAKQQQQQYDAVSGVPIIAAKTAPAAAAMGVGNAAVIKSVRSRQVGPLQTPDEVLQAAAKKLEQQQQQQQQHGGMNQSVESLGASWSNQAAASTSITSMISVKRSKDMRRSADVKRSVEWGTRQGLLPPAGPTAAAAAGSSAAVNPGISQVGREGSASFKAWLPVRISCDRPQGPITVPAEQSTSNSTTVAAAAAAAMCDTVARDQQQQQQQPDMRVSIDKRMRYSGDYGSLRGSQDLDHHSENGTNTTTAAAADPAAAAAKGANKTSQNDADNTNETGAAAAAASSKKEYILELLAIVPGRGKLSGKPVLSSAAHHQPHLDIQQLTRATLHPADKPLLPPKPQTGFRGWVRRHLSVNVRAPASAGRGVEQQVQGRQQQTDRKPVLWHK